MSQEDSKSALEQIIDKMVADKTFSLDAMEAVKKLKDTAAKTASDLEVARRELKDSKQYAETLSSTLSSVRAELSAWTTRDASLTKREAEITQLEKTAAVEAARAEAFRWSMSTVFAPNVVRTAVQKFGSAAGPNGISSPTHDCGHTAVSDGYGQKEAGYLDATRPQPGQ